MLQKFSAGNKGAYIYIISNNARTVLYTGVTADLQKRIAQHEAGQGSTFTITYQCRDLLYYEVHAGIEAATAREKQLKKWKRAWKEALIKSVNPGMRTLDLTA